MCIPFSPVRLPCSTVGDSIMDRVVAFNQPMARPRLSMSVFPQHTVVEPSQSDSPDQSFREAVDRANEVALPIGHDKQDWLR